MFAPGLASNPVQQNPAQQNQPPPSNNVERVPVSEYPRYEQPFQGQEPWESQRVQWSPPNPGQNPFANDPHARHIPMVPLFPSVPPTLNNLPRDNGLLGPPGSPRLQQQGRYHEASAWFPRRPSEYSAQYSNPEQYHQGCPAVPEPANGHQNPSAQHWANPGAGNREAERIILAAIPTNAAEYRPWRRATIMSIVSASRDAEYPQRWLMEMEHYDSTSLLASILNVGLWRWNTMIPLLCLREKTSTCRKSTLNWPHHF